MVRLLKTLSKVSLCVFVLFYSVSAFSAEEASQNSEEIINDSSEETEVKKKKKSKKKKVAKKKRKNKKKLAKSKKKAESNPKIINLAKDLGISDSEAELFLLTKPAPAGMAVAENTEEAVDPNAKTVPYEKYLAMKKSVKKVKTKLKKAFKYLKKYKKRLALVKNKLNSARKKLKALRAKQAEKTAGLEKPQPVALANNLGE